MREQLKELAALKYASQEISGDAPPAAQFRGVRASRVEAAYFVVARR
jgi:hypothetical protein